MHQLRTRETTASRIRSVGIDVSKRELVVALVADDAVIGPRPFANSADGIESMVRFLQTHGTAFTVPCVVESTGDLHLQPSLLLTHQGYTVKCINPIITKQYQRASIRNAKSDSVDAVRLARIGLSEDRLSTFQATNETLTLKKLTASCAHIERLMQELSRHIEQTETTAQTLGLGIDLPEAKVALKLLARQRKHLLERLVAARSSRAEALAGMSKGLSDHKLAVLDTFLRERTFDTRDQLVAFCGLDVAVRQSGSWRGKEHLSKRGNGYLRKTLYHIAWGLARYCPPYKAYCQRLRARGKHFTICLSAVARKFLRFIFAWYYGSLRLSTTLVLT